MLVLALATPLAACAAASGDLGRVDRDSIITSSVPSDPSGINRTDEEVEMENRIWRFLDAPHSKPWFRPLEALIPWHDPIETGMRRQGQPARLQASDAPDLYYDMLASTAYRSSRTRYVTVADDAEADIALTPAVFDIICRVRRIDERRQIAVSELAADDRASIDRVSARHEENQRQADAFTMALRFRYDAYSTALDRLLIETPHAEAWSVDEKLSELAYQLELAERGDFCSSENGPVFKGEEPDNVLPSRVGQSGYDMPPIILGS
jgi:hypothetical protein